ncbi:MAG: PLP-dependent aspartate aminotransferase family protein [Candidatus Binatia bacterium]
MAKAPRQIDTDLIHAGEPTPRIEGAVTVPIFQSSTFEYAGAKSYHDLKYIRLSNTPNHRVLHAKLAALERGEAALVTASGMAAVSTVLLALTRAGDHLLMQDCLYGGTHDLITQDLPGLGVQVDFIDADAPETWERKLRAETRAIYVETLTNPLLQLGDLDAIVVFAKAHGLISIVDNTFASPINFRPLTRGFDLTLHSCTKYMNGHDDIVAGAVIGRAPLVERAAHKLAHLGGSLDPHAAFLLHRGMKTLAVRVRQQNQNALAIARFLAGHPAVATVNYPGLESHPRHARARSLFEGFGGMLSFELRGGVEAADRLLANVQLPISAPSLGGVETLITRPALTSHSGMTPADRQRVGISDGLIRLSVGIEAAEDLIADLAQALDA